MATFEVQVTASVQQNICGSDEQLTIVVKRWSPHENLLKVRNKLPSNEPRESPKVHLQAEDVNDELLPAFMDQ